MLSSGHLFVCCLFPLSFFSSHLYEQRNGNAHNNILSHFRVLRAKRVRSKCNLFVVTAPKIVFSHRGRTNVNTNTGRCMLLCNADRFVFDRNFFPSLSVPLCAFLDIHLFWCSVAKVLPRESIQTEALSSSIAAITIHSVVPVNACYRFEINNLKSISRKSNLLIYNAFIKNDQSETICGSWIRLHGF